MRPSLIATHLPRWRSVFVTNSAGSNCRSALGGLRVVGAAVEGCRRVGREREVVEHLAPTAPDAPVLVRHPANGERPEAIVGKRLQALIGGCPRVVASERVEPLFVWRLV